MKKGNKFFASAAIIFAIMLILFNSCKKKEESEPIIESSVTDNEGNIYKAVTVGSQVWMAENLKVSKYQNGDLIGTTDIYKDISNEVSPKYQWAYIDGARLNAESNVATYGRLYTWAVVTDSRKICPVGWHVPSQSEWKKLIDYVGGDHIAGGMLKETGYTHWNSPNQGATDKYGFSALGSGSRSEKGGTGNLLMLGYWWSGTEYELNPTRAWQLTIVADFQDAGLVMTLKNSGNSVRCIKD
jgi:uncharacterized protein (TIGR02145 family)